MKPTNKLLFMVLSFCVMLSLLSTVALAAPGDNLWISDTLWGQLIDPTGAPVYAKGDQIHIPVTITATQGTILVTTPGAGTTEEEKSMPELDGTTGLYKNVVYIDDIIAPASQSIYNYAFGFDYALVTKGQTLYVKVGGTNLPAGDHQKATTTYLGATKPNGSYTAAVDSSKNLVITTPRTTLAVPPSVSWSNPKVTLTISSNSITREIATGITATDTTITVPNSALTSAFSDLSLSEITITNIAINDSVIENTALDNQTTTVAVAAASPNYGDVNNDGVIDISDVIMAAEIAVGYDGYTADQKVRANVDSATDMTIDISDVVLIAERAVGGTTAFPIEAQ